jgi:hypothetical protein
MQQPSCSQCAHWHGAPLSIENLGQTRQGECREQLHSAAFPVAGGRGQGVGILIHAFYPQVPGNFQPCSRFTLRQVMGGVDS